jgi:hypothetical protein
MPEPQSTLRHDLHEKTLDLQSFNLASDALGSRHVMVKSSGRINEKANGGRGTAADAGGFFAIRKMMTFF